MSNPAVAAFYAGSGLTIFAFISAVVTLAARRVRKRQHPALGTLILLYDDFDDTEQGRREVWRMSLDSQRSNRVVVRRGLPRPFKQLIITCDNASMNQRRQVRIEAIFNEGPSKRMFMNPQSEQTLVQGADFAYILIKDPSFYE